MEKIYRGMASGAENINKNFTDIDNNFSKKDAIETISGDKTFTGKVIIKNQQQAKAVRTNVAFGFSSLATLTRIGNIVNLVIKGAYKPSTGYRALTETIPLGFRPSIDTGIAATGMVEGQGTVIPLGWNVSPSGSMTSSGGNGSQLTVYATATWFTDDAMVQ